MFRSLVTFGFALGAVAGPVTPAQAQVPPDWQRIDEAPDSVRKSVYQIRSGGLIAVPAPNDPQQAVQPLLREVASPQRAWTQFLIQFDAAPSYADIALLTSEGVNLIAPKALGTYDAEANERGLRFLATYDPVRWIGRIPEAVKTADVRDAGTAARALRSDARVAYRVRFTAGTDADEAADLVAAAEGVLDGLDVEALERVMQTGAPVPVALRAEGLEALARRPEVLQILPAAPRLAPNNARARAAVDADVLQSRLALDGSGIDVGIWEADDDADTVDIESSVYRDHVDLTPRANNAPQNSPEDSLHATHVAGTIAGTGGGDSAARGIAPGATLHSFDIDFDYAGVSPLVELREAATSGSTLYGTDSITVSNHSYGAILGWRRIDGTNDWEHIGFTHLFGSYAAALGFDKAVRDLNTLPVFSIGNDGNDDPGADVWRDAGEPPDCRRFSRAFDSYCVDGNGSGKNVLGVGALDGRALADFSSVGPSRDGRIKPDLVAPGEQTYSTDKYRNRLFRRCQDACYERLSGTSMAAPVVTGAVALLQEYAALSGNSSWPAALYRAALVHTARDAGPPGPDFQTGWGVPNVDAAVRLLRGNQGRDVEVAAIASHTPATPERRCFFTPQPGQDLRVTLAWDDIAGQALVNDLDLIVASPDGRRVFRSWTLDPTDPLAPARRGVDRLHALEVVDVPAADVTPGFWTAEVRVASAVQVVSQRYAMLGVDCDPDIDDDGVLNLVDNCLETPNAQQTDTDRNGKGNRCDPDDDGDLVLDDDDNCRLDPNTAQTDTDGDGIGNACDRDDDGDCVSDANDTCPQVANCNYFGEAAEPGLCTDPCLEGGGILGEYRGTAYRDVLVEVVGLPVWREFATDIGMIVHHCREDWSQTVEPRCFETGCPLPPMLDGGRLEELIQRIGERVEPGFSGLRAEERGETVRLPMAAAGYANGIAVHQLMGRHPVFFATARRIVGREIGFERLTEAIDPTEERLAELERLRAGEDPGAYADTMTMMALRSPSPDIRAPICRGLINDLAERAARVEEGANRVYKSCRETKREEAAMCQEVPEGAVCR